MEGEQEQTNQFDDEEEAAMMMTMQMQQQHPPPHYSQHTLPEIYGYHIDPRMDPRMMAVGHTVHPAYRYQPHYGYQYPVQHMEGVPLPPGIPGLGGSTDPLEAVLGPFPCARLRNLPYDASIEDILALFQGLVVIDAVLVGQGEAFVIFANPMDFQMALQRTRQTIGRRFIEISSASRAEYYEAIATQHLQEQEMRRPQLTRGSGMTDQGTGDEPQQSGEAAAVAALWASQTSATPGGGPPQLHPPPPLQQMYGETMVPSGRGTPGGLTLAGPPGRPGSVGSRGPPGGLHAPLQKRTGGGIQVGEHTGFLRMRGLPFIASKEDILKFFEGYNPVPESIVLTYRNDGRATGEAYVGFSSPDDSRRAMELHRKTMGARYIELFISNKDEQGRALARFGNR